MMRTNVQRLGEHITARSWAVDAMSAEVAIAAGTGGALGHATAATLAVGGRIMVAAGRNEHALRDLQVMSTPRRPPPTPLRRRSSSTGSPARPGRGVPVSTIGVFAREMRIPRCPMCCGSCSTST